MLLSLCFLGQEGTLERTIPWFGLLPLFISMDRHRRDLKWRLLHGLFFGLILCCWPLVMAKDGSGLSILDVAETSPIRIGFWILFCVAGGSLLQQGSRLAVVPGLAVLWTGLEYLQAECIPLAVPWMQLGQALKPENPEAQLAMTAGLAGLGFTICLVNGAFFLALRERRGSIQLLAALAGTLVVVGMLGTGAMIENSAGPENTLRVGLVQTDEGRNSEHLQLARQLLKDEPQLIFFPADSFTVSSDRYPWLKEDLQTFARSENVQLVAGVIARPGDKDSQDQAAHQTLLHIGSDGSPDDVTSRYALPLKIEGKSIIVVPDLINHSARLMSRWAASRDGASLFLVAGGEIRGGGAYDHLRDRLQAFRAMEMGTWICRTTRHGSSTIVDDRGVRQAVAPRAQAWASVRSIPLRSTGAGHSPFITWGWIIGPGCLTILGVLLCLEIYRRRKKLFRR